MQRLDLPRIYGLLLPALLTITVLFVLPMLVILVYAFLKPGAYGGVEWQFTLDAYRQFLFEQDFDGTWIFNSGYLQVFARSFKLAGIATLLCLLAGFPTAYYMATRPPKQRNLWIWLITLPFWTSLLVRTYAWMLILRDEGLINYALQKTGLMTAPLPLLYNDFAIAVGLLYSYLPFMVLPIFANLERMDWRLVEAAADLYASRAQILRRVIIPLCLPGIIAGCVLAFVPAIGSFLAPDLLGGGRQLMIGNMIQMQFGVSRNWPFGAASSVILLGIVLIPLALMARKGRVGVKGVD